MTLHHFTDGTFSHNLNMLLRIINAATERSCHRHEDRNCLLIFNHYDLVIIRFCQCDFHTQVRAVDATMSILMRLFYLSIFVIYNIPLLIGDLNLPTNIFSNIPHGTAIAVSHMEIYNHTSYVLKTALAERKQV